MLTFLSSLLDSTLKSYLGATIARILWNWFFIESDGEEDDENDEDEEEAAFIGH